MCWVMQMLDALAVGDTIEVRGPFGHFTYDRPGHYRTPKAQVAVRRINMVAGGTGITALYPIMLAVLRRPEDSTALRLLYANKTEADIVLRAELEALAKSHPDRCGSTAQHSTARRVLVVVVC